MSSKFPIIEKADVIWRNNQPFSVQFQDIYFTPEDALSEIAHVFIDGNNLIQRWQQLNSDSLFTIAETGFGSGLNFLVAWDLWTKTAPDSAVLHFISCEKFPLKLEDLKRCLSNFPELRSYAAQLVDAYPVLTPGFHQLSFEQGRLKLTLFLGDVLDCYEQLLICGDAALETSLRQEFVNAWFLDGFAPAKNEDMWAAAFFHSMALLSKKDTSVSTFSAAALVKKHLASYGFEVYKMKGFGRKRHMLKARFLQAPNLKHRKRQTPWYYAKPQKIHHKKAIVIGAGFAGASISRKLAEAGWQVRIIEQHSAAGQGASANTQAVLFPKLSPFYAPLSELMLSGFLYSQQFLKAFVDPLQFKGILLLAYNEKEKKLQSAIAEWMGHYPELGSYLTAEHASAVAGITLQSEALLIKDSGYLDMQALCKQLIDHKNIKLLSNIRVDRIERQDKAWLVAGELAETVIIANAAHSIEFEQTRDHYPIKPLRGQMTAVRPWPETQFLKLPICAQAHILPPVNNNLQWIGASYHPGSADSSCRPEDDRQTISQIQSSILNYQSETEIRGSWASVRASTADYMPVVGHVPVALEFFKQYERLQFNSRQWLAHPMPSYSGLYLFSGFGSKALSTAPLLAEHLLSLIEGLQSPLSNRLIAALTPARFLYRKLIRGKSLTA